MSYQGSLSAHRYAACSFSVAQEYAEDYLRDATFGSKDAFVTLGAFRRPIRFRFGVRSDTTERGREHEEIVLHWVAGTRWLPNFDGTLRMRPSMPGTDLLLEGAYVPPGGALGAVFDRLVGRRFAHATAKALLEQIAATLAEREATWRAKVIAASPTAFSRGGASS